MVADLFLGKVSRLLERHIFNSSQANVVVDTILRIDKIQIMK